MLQTKRSAYLSNKTTTLFDNETQRMQHRQQFNQGYYNTNKAKRSNFALFTIIQRSKSTMGTLTGNIH